MLLIWPCDSGLLRRHWVNRMWLLQGRGLLSQFSPFRYFPHFPLLSKKMVAIEYHVYIWQVSPQLSCGDTCQIWMWFMESNSYFCKIENFAYGEISERSFSNPHPSAGKVTLKSLGNIGQHMAALKRNMMTSSNENIFRVTGPLYGEFTGHRWIPLTKASDQRFDVFFDLRLNKRFSKQLRRRWFETSSRSLRVTVMKSSKTVHTYQDAMCAYTDQWLKTGVIDALFVIVIFRHRYRLLVLPVCQHAEPLLTYQNFATPVIFQQKYSTFHSTKFEIFSAHCQTFCRLPHCSCMVICRNGSKFIGSWVDT